MTRRLFLNRSFAITALTAVALLLAPSVKAERIILTFSGQDGSVSFNGGTPANIDLTVQLVADTNNLQLGTGALGSDRYANLIGIFSSTALGLSKVPSTTLLAVDIGTPGLGPPFNESTALLNDGTNVNGLFDSPAIASWDRKSAIGPLFMPATASGPINITLANSDTLQITNFDNAVPFADSFFQATTPAAPEPGSLALLGVVALPIAGLVRRRQI